MIRSSRLALALVITTALAPSLAHGADWDQLAVGNRWEYQGVAGYHEVIHITGTFTLRGRVVSIKHYDEGINAGLENYWLLDPDGSVLVAGFTTTDGISYAYEPPIRYLDGPPTVGAKPPQFITVYDLHTNTVVAAQYYQFDITENVLLNLPAGSFQALGVGLLPTSGPAAAAQKGLTVDGRVLSAVPAGIPGRTTDWFSEGVGVVQSKTSDLYQLVGFGQPTPTLARSWGAIKRLYR